MLAPAAGEGCLATERPLLITRHRRTAANCRHFGLIIRRSNTASNRHNHNITLTRLRIRIHSHIHSRI